MNDNTETQLARPELRKKPTVILGGGPAGLTAGHLMAKQEDSPWSSSSPGVRRHRQGDRDGYRFDLGGHRFFHEGQGGRRPLARDHARGLPRRPACRTSSGTASSSTTAARPRRDQEARPGRADARSSTCGRRSSRRARRTPSSSGCQRFPASASSTCSSSPTPRRSGACRRRRSAPSGRPSRSRACRSSAPPRPRSSATAATRSNRSSRGVQLPRYGPGRCGRRWRTTSSRPAAVLLEKRVTKLEFGGEALRARVGRRGELGAVGGGLVGAAQHGRHLGPTPSPR